MQVLAEQVFNLRSKGSTQHGTRLRIARISKLRRRPTTTRHSHVLVTVTEPAERDGKVAAAMATEAPEESAPIQNISATLVANHRDFRSSRSA